MGIEVQIRHRVYSYRVQNPGGECNKCYNISICKVLFKKIRETCFSKEMIYNVRLKERVGIWQNYVCGWGERLS